MDKHNKSILIIFLATLTAVVIYILIPGLYGAIGEQLSNSAENSAKFLFGFLVDTFIPFALEYLLYIVVAIICLYIFSAFYYSNNK